MTFPALCKNVCFAKQNITFNPSIAFKLRSNLLRDSLASFLFALLLLFIPSNALAQSSKPTPNSALQNQVAQPITPISSPITNYNTPNINPEVPRNQHIFVQSAMIEVISSVFCIITGIDPIVPAQGCLDIDPKTHKLGLTQPQAGEPRLGGLMGFLPGMFNIAYRPPTSSTEYFRHIAGSFGITQPAYAATGGGFEALSPLVPLWTTARNVSYLLFVLVFIVIGLAIMLRVKIDPRTVMTLQNQIPRIIIGILLVTFSYAIAAIMIDGMWLLTYTGINAITQASPTSNPRTTGCTPNLTLQQRATQNLISTPFNYADQVLKKGCSGVDGITSVTWDVGNAIGTIVGDTLKAAITGKASGKWESDYAKACPIGWALTGNFWSCVFGTLGVIFGGFVGLIAGVLALIIVFLALMWALFTLWIELLKAYVMLILYIIGAPLWIVTGLLPGKPLGFDKWFRRMFVHLAVFPAVACLLVVASVMANIFNDAPAGALVPPLIGQSNLAGFGSLLAFAVILMAPTLLEVLKENLHAASKGGQIAAGGVVRGISGGAAAPKGLASGIWGVANRRGYMGDASMATKYVAGLAGKILPEKYAKTAQNIIYKVGGESDLEKKTRDTKPA